MQDTNALYAEAEAAYRKFWAEKERLHRAGGAAELSSVMLETTTGEYRQWTLEYLQELRATKATAVGGAYGLVWFRRVPDEVRQGSIVTLRMCLDSRSVTVDEKGQKPGPGLVSEETGFFVRDIDGLLKITTSTFKDVKKC